MISDLLNLVVDVCTLLLKFGVDLHLLLKTSVAFLELSYFFAKLLLEYLTLMEL